MNKLKILIPSLGMLLLSTAGTVSGSLAWFTANRTVTVSTTNFQVGSLDSDLDVTVSSLVGTTVSDKVVSIVSGGRLTDGSFDHINKVVYTADKSVLSDGEQPTVFEVVGNNVTNPAADAWKAEDSAAAAPFYYAIAWKMTFSNEFNGSTAALNLFFSPKDSSSLSEVPEGGEDKPHTYEGFRIAFFAGDEVFVWAPYRTAAQVTGLVNTHRTQADVNPDPSFPNGMHYVKALTENQWGNYTAGTDIITGFGESYGVANAEEGDNNQTSRVDYLGQLTPEADELTVTCVAWYEGDDPTVVNSASKDQVSNSLKFYVRKAAE